MEAAVAEIDENVGAVDSGRSAAKDFTWNSKITSVSLELIDLGKGLG